MEQETTTGIDAAINAAVEPIAAAVSSFIFYSVPVAGTELPLIVAWLILAAAFFTLYFGFINIRGFVHAVRLVKGDYTDPRQTGEVSHFQALATAVSGTVGIGNIGGVAIIITLGGPGATFWLMLAGFLGMSTKLVECIAGVKYRRINEDGTVSGGPMYYIEQVMRARGLGLLAKPMGGFYALAIVIGCLGIGNMFQSNQAFEQFVYITGGDDSPFRSAGWAFGLIIATLVGVVIIGGLKSIARVTSRLVPFMTLAYLLFSITIILLNAERLPWAVSAIFSEAFQPQGMAGGFVGVMILGFQRAVFSNEAGIGSAAIAHSAVRTAEPATEGYVGLLEPFIDTVVVCTLTALVILTTIYEPTMGDSGVQGVELTSRAFASTLPWSTVPLSFIAVLFAFSTMIAWAYYGLKGWTYLVGEGKLKEAVFKFVFCLFGILGCTVQLEAVLSFSDALVFLISLPNIIGLYLLAPVVKEELQAYWERFAERQQARARDGQSEG
ncbi:MAG: alanine/glycine:cation symporter family protein [Pseudohongiellaceae bacterium]